MNKPEFRRSWDKQTDGQTESDNLLKTNNVQKSLFAFTKLH